LGTIAIRSFSQFVDNFKVAALGFRLDLEQNLLQTLLTDGEGTLRAV
jgi:hypothetical protein